MPWFCSMGHLPCRDLERAERSPAIPSTHVGDLWHRQYELSEASRALLTAARAGDRFLVEKQLGRLGKPNCCNAAGLTPLHAATELGRADLVLLLLEHHADVGAPPGPSFDGPPIALASHRGYLGCVEALLAAHASPKATSNPYDSTCVHRAAAEGHAQCIRVLLAAHPPTSKAVGAGGLERTILRHGDLIANFQDANERLPLHRASAPGHCECVDLLIREGFSLLDERDFDCNAALHLAALTLDEQRAAAIADALLHARGDANVRDAQQRTALHLAAGASRAQVTAVLLRHAADVGAAEARRGRTPLHVAARSGAREVCAQLIAARADVRACSRDGSGTPQMCAAPACQEVLAAAMRRAERGTYFWRRDLLDVDAGGGLAA